jgi:hypothetical protein
VRQKRHVALPKAGKQEWLRYARRVSHRDGIGSKDKARARRRHPLESAVAVRRCSDMGWSGDYWL